MRDEIEQLQRKQVQPFGINPASLESHARYAAKFRFPFPLLSDGDRSVAGAYGALKPGGKRIQRTVVVVSPDGRVAFARRGAPSPAEILRELGA